MLHRVAGRSLVGHVLSAVSGVGLDRVVVVVSANTEAFTEALEADGLGMDVELVVQDPPAGTADAVRIALDHIGSAAGSALIVAGDTPLIDGNTLGTLLGEHDERGSSVTLLTADVENPAGYGRIVRSEDGSVDRIVEDADATDEERSLAEINSGTYVFDLERLTEMIAKVDKENRQGEYYLTDMVELLRSAGDGIGAVLASEEEVRGVNTRVQLASVREALNRKTCEALLEQGVGIVDPSTTYIDVTVEIAPEAVILPFTFLEGRTRIGERAEVGPQTRIVDSEIGPDAEVSFAVVRDSIVGPEASVGPFASLRPGTRLERGARAGTFVETKKTTIGEGSKANHLAYLGDAEIGRGVNVGAGSITCNWDGKEKHKTIIEDDAYIASDTMLVAPTRIGKRAATGAGSVVRGDVPDDALAVGVPARIIEGKGDKLGRKPGKKSPPETEGDAGGAGQ